MTLALVAACGALGCFERVTLPGDVLRPQVAGAVPPGRAGVLCGLSVVVLPEGWAAFDGADGVELLCPRHAEAGPLVAELSRDTDLRDVDRSGRL